MACNFFFAVITVGYNETNVTIFESAGVVQLTVAISESDPPVTIESDVSFSLHVNTFNRTATGWY